MRLWTVFGVCVAVAASAVTLARPDPVRAQTVYAYPLAGQSEEQQGRDRWECHSWSVQQTGYDPSQPIQAAQPSYSAPPPSSSSQPSVLGTAARGAAGGAVIGAIAGNAGKGAAIGAATTTLFGGVKRNNAKKQEQAWQQQQQAQAQQAQQQAQQDNQAQTQNYNRAYASCMQARQYQVN